MANYKDTMDQIRGQIANLAEILEQTVDASSKTDFMAAVKQRVNQADQSNNSIARKNSKTENGNISTSTRATSKRQSTTSTKNEKTNENLVSLLTKFIIF